MKETRLVTKIIKGLQTEYGSNMCLFKIHGGPHQKQGIPDIVGCLNGDFFGIEVKNPGREDKATPLQLNALRKIRMAGGIAGIATSLDEALEILSERQASTR